MTFCTVLQMANSVLTPSLSSFLQWLTADVLSLPPTESLLLPALRLGLLSCIHVRRGTPYKAATTPSVRQTAGGQRNRVACVSVHASYTHTNTHTPMHPCTHAHTLRSVCVMAVLWLCYGCVMAVLWLCYGCVMMCASCLCTSG